NLRGAGLVIGRPGIVKSSVRDLELDVVVAQLDRPQLLACDPVSGLLTGNAPLSVSQDVVDGGRHCRQSSSSLACRYNRRKAAGNPLCQECRRQFAGLPWLVKHQGREERDVVAYARDEESIERIHLRRYPASRVGACVMSFAMRGS